MVEHVWSVLCTRSIIDKSTNNASLLEILEQVTILEPIPTGQQNIALALAFEIVSLWQRSNHDEPARGEGRIRIEMASGSQTLPQFQIDITPAGMHRRRSVYRMNGMPFDGFGVYKFVVELKDESTSQWKAVATIPLELSQGVPQPPGISGTA